MSSYNSILFLLDEVYQRKWEVTIKMIEKERERERKRMMMARLLSIE